MTGASHVCGHVWAHVILPTAYEPSGCRVSVGGPGQDRSSQSRQVGDGLRGMGAFQPLTSYTTACPGRAGPPSL